MKSFQVSPSVEYSKDTDGAEPLEVIATVEFASSAVNVSPWYEYLVVMCGNTL